ncbi:outer surface protein VlsE (plasmid) [Borreliella burgdorferi]|uniref:variable large family protein n=1 Tax=Borreliella burgdorferi TaxID=139 RepID=UPI000E296238|nr:variable large family protein [Borreliella burgdorferi]AXK69950.1 outer surface protein VlsE [Borreliella burgdorferi]
MKRISSAIFLLAFFVFTNCKNNAELVEAEAKHQAAKDFYHAIIKLGYGFVDVFNAIGGLVSDVFYKADPKKSDVKNYFESIAKILQDTQAKLDALSKEQGGGDRGTQVVDTSKKVSGWIKEMHKAVDDTAKAGDGGNESIANVAAGGDADNAGAGAKANADSVTGIAKGMKAIVEAAKKAGVELKAADADDVADGNDAGRLFASGNNAGAADAAQGAAEKAGEAVSAVSGDQILKAIVDAAESTGGKGANTATNAVEAAIGGDGNAAAFGDANMKKNQIAAAIVLRGLAKDGKFANANAANGKVKAAVKSAVESGVQKTMSSLSSLIRQSIVKELGKVANVVQEAKSTATNGGGTSKKAETTTADAKTE